MSPDLCRWVKYWISFKLLKHVNPYKYVGFSFCLISNEMTDFLFQQNRFFLRSQAFASPTDMASSGVWENVFLAITSTFDGVCRMLWFIILGGFFAKIWHICHLLLNLANFFWYFLWQMLLSLFLLTTIWCCWQMLLPVGCYGWCSCHCGRCKSHIICLCKPTIIECFCCGRCYYHIIRLMYLP